MAVTEVTSTTAPTDTTAAPFTDTTTTNTAAPNTTVKISSTTAPTTDATTAPTTTNTSVPPAGLPPVLDFSTASIGGYALRSPVDGLVETFTTSLGAPTTDTGWRPVGPIERCSFNDEYRYVAWSDVLFLLERAPDTPASVAGWALGDEVILGPIPPERSGDPATGITTADGVGLGSDTEEIGDEFRMLSDDGGVVVVGDLPVLVAVAVADGSIAGFAAGPLDCPALDLSEFSCARPIPIRVLPDGSETSDVMVDEGAAIWGAETAGPNGENVVTQVLAGPDQGQMEAAVQSPIGARREPLDIRVVPDGEVPSATSQIVVFDAGTECVRLLRVGPGLSEDQLQAYAEVLVDRLEERR